MALKLNTTFFLNFCFLLFAVSFFTFVFTISGSADEASQLPPSLPADEGIQETDGGDRSARRLLIGSTAPICTYNECRGCKTRCRAEQVPVDANDPINSAYRYRCVCQRW